MLSLCVSFLVGCYVLKIFFPQEFILGIDNERIVAIGGYIDTHKWASILFGIIVGIVFDWLYFGAVTKRLVPHYALIATIVAYNVALALFYNFAPIDIVLKHATTIMGISSCYMIVTPMFFIKEIKPLSITYGVNAISQVALLFIRDLPMSMTTLNTIASFIWGIDNYLWIALCYIIFNYNRLKKEI